MLDKPIKASVLTPKEYMTPKDILALDLWAHTGYHVNMNRDIFGRVKTKISFLRFAFAKPDKSVVMFQNCYTKNTPREYLGDCQLKLDYKANLAHLFDQHDNHLLTYIISFEDLLNNDV